MQNPLLQASLFYTVHFWVGSLYKYPPYTHSHKRLKKQEGNYCVNFVKDYLFKDSRKTEQPRFNVDVRPGSLILRPVWSIQFQDNWEYIEPVSNRDCGGARGSPIVEKFLSL